MPGYLLHVGAVVQCTHQAPSTTTPSARIIVAGSAALLQPFPGSGAGACLNAEQAPQGPVLISDSGQIKVSSQ